MLEGVRKELKVWSDECVTCFAWVRIKQSFAAGYFSTSFVRVVCTRLEHNLSSPSLFPPLLCTASYPGHPTRSFECRNIVAVRPAWSISCGSVMSTNMARSLSPVRHKHDVLAASNKRKRGTHVYPQPRPHGQQHSTPLELLVRGRGAVAAHTATTAPPPPATSLSPPLASLSAQLRGAVAVDLQTDSIIDLLSSQQQHHTSPQQRAPDPPPANSPRRGTARPPPPPSPPRVRSPPTSVQSGTVSTAHPLPVAQLDASKPSPPPPLPREPAPRPPAGSLSPPSPPTCHHTITATSPSAPKSTIASYIHRFRTQPPLHERERQKRLQQHHELPHRDFWWLRRHDSTDEREEGKSESQAGSEEHAKDEATMAAQRPVSSSTSRLSILPAIEAVLSEEEKRVTAELASWSRSRHSHPPSAVPAQPNNDASIASRAAPPPIASPAAIIPSQHPPQIAPSTLAPPTIAPSFFSPLPTTAAAVASSSLHPQPTLPYSTQHTHHPIPTTAAPIDATPPLSAASLTHRDNILRLARELRLPGLSSIAAHDLPTAFPAPPVSDQWTAAPLADSYSLIPRRAGQWMPVSPARMSTVSPLLSASTASSIPPPSHAASVLSSRAAADVATTCEDVDVDDILAQWRRNHRLAEAQQHTVQPAAAAAAAQTSGVNKPHTATQAEPGGKAVTEAEDTSTKVESVVEQVVDAVMKRLKEEKRDEQTAATAHTQSAEKAPTTTASDVEEKNTNEHSATPPTAASTSSTPSPSLAKNAISNPPSGSKWRDRKKSLSLQLPPHPSRIANRPPPSAASSTASSTIQAPTAATSAGSLRPQQTQWVAPARSKPAIDAHSTATASIAAHPPAASAAAPKPVVPSPSAPRPVVSLSSPPSLLTGALSAVVGRALTCPAPSFADHVHSAMARQRRVSSENSEQLRMEDLDDVPSAAQLLDNAHAERTDGKKDVQEAEMDGTLFAGRLVQVEQSTLVSSACPPAPLSTASTSLPVTFSSVRSTGGAERRPNVLSASAVSHTSVPPTAGSPPLASVSLPAVADHVADAMQASFSLPSMSLLPTSSSSQTALQVQLAPSQPTSFPFFTLPASMAALYALTSSALHMPHAGPVFIPIMMSAPPHSSSSAVTQPPLPPASTQIQPPPPNPPPPAAAVPPSPTRPAAAVPAPPPAPPVNLEAELAELLSSLHVSASLFADEPRLQTVVSRMRQLQSGAVST